ncbi:MAG: hypothetical protein FOGNACKC_02911 [Anaerolineae bacterium]|nr:hypothetical protein [Anaerolineae bacterium]
MGHSDESRHPSHQLIRSVLVGLPNGWLILLFDLYLVARRWLTQQRHEGLYEILDYDATLELKDRRGETAIFTKRQQVKFIQDHILAFEDYAWGDGDIFAAYQCTPGVPVDRYPVGDRWNILISLRETKQSGDVTDFHIQRTIKNGFVKPEESFQTEISHRTRRLKMTIIFPKSRRCRRAALLERSRHRHTELGPEHFTDLPDGRQQVIWETDKVRPFEVYTLKWQW